MSAAAQTVASDDPLAMIWRAIGDPTRRAILDLLRERPRTTGELADAFPQSRFAVMKHLEVLVGAGLVVSRREGRERWNSVNPVPLRQIYERWVRPYEAMWSESLIRLKEAAESPPPESRMGSAAIAGQQNAGVLTVQLEIPIKAAPSRVWQLLIDDVRAWWPEDFLATSADATMRFDARLGGHLAEEAADGGGVVWYTVVAISPGRSVDLAGQLSVAFGGPAQTLLHLALRAEGAHTVLELTDAVVGRITDRTAATLEEGWRAVFETGFKSYVERNATEADR